MQTNVTIRKRLHVSGLTPAITVNNINARLKSFGHVLALDGFGALDAVGNPRKFAYVTLEATESNLARCLNVLSGTTWKGTKLRIGEAKPDYAQRLENERQAAAEAAERPSKRRKLRGVQGIHSKSMSPVDVHNADTHAGWYKTTLLHLIRPMKMRPSRPLPAPTLGTIREDSKSSPKKRKKLQLRRPDPPTRARVRTIDPRLYGSVHLRENMLEDVVIDTRATQKPKPHAPSPSPSSAEEGDNFPTPLQHRDLSPASTSSGQVDAPSGMPDFVEEKQRDLGLLMSMFGDDENDWGGQDSVDSDVDIPAAYAEGLDAGEHPEKDTSPPPPEPKESNVKRVPPPAETNQKKSLKDIFKPQEQETGFSLLSSLGGIDLDPGFDFNFAGPDLDPVVAPVPIIVPQPSTFAQSVPSHTLDPTLPLFFPQPDNPRAKDLFTIARAEQWKFGRSGDTETIRQRWDETKGALTRQWKKRSREAVKARKRRYGAVEGEDA